MFEFLCMAILLWFWSQEGPCCYSYSNTNSHGVGCEKYYDNDWAR